MNFMEEKLLSEAEKIEETEETKKENKKKRVEALKKKYKEEGGKVYEVTVSET